MTLYEAVCRNITILFAFVHNTVSQVRVDIFISSGEFGDVYKGTLKTEDRDVIEVAAKTLKVEFLNWLEF